MWISFYVSKSNYMGKVKMIPKNRKAVINWLRSGNIVKVGGNFYNQKEFEKQFYY